MLGMDCIRSRMIDLVFLLSLLCIVLLSSVTLQQASKQWPVNAMWCCIQCSLHYIVTLVHLFTDMWLFRYVTVFPFQSLVLLSSLPYTNLFHTLLQLIAPEYFNKLEPCLEAGKNLNIFFMINIDESRVVVPTWSVGFLGWEDNADVCRAEVLALKRSEINCFPKWPTS